VISSHISYIIGYNSISWRPHDSPTPKSGDRNPPNHRIDDYEAAYLTDKYCPRMCTFSRTSCLSVLCAAPPISRNNKKVH